MRVARTTTAQALELLRVLQEDTLAPGSEGSEGASAAAAAGAGAAIAVSAVGVGEAATLKFRLLASRSADISKFMQSAHLVSAGTVHT